MSPFSLSSPSQPTKPDPFAFQLPNAPEDTKLKNEVAEAEYRRLHQLYRQGEPQKAIQEAARYLTENGYRYEFAFLLFSLCQLENDVETLQDAFAQFKIKLLNAHEFNCLSGMKFYAERDYTNCVDRLSKLPFDTWFSGSVVSMLADSYMRTGNYEKCIKWYQTLSKHRSLTAHQNLCFGFALMRLDQCDEALKYFELSSIPGTTRRKSLEYAAQCQARLKRKRDCFRTVRELLKEIWKKK